MWPFKKKTKKLKPAESVEKNEIPLEKTYAQWKEEYNTLETENAVLEDECAKEGLDWVMMLRKTADIKQKMAHADKMMRKLQEPSLTYNKKWKGKKLELESFISAAVAKEILDTDGEGYYATETAKTDIIIRPSDILENIYRTDFPYVLWIPKQ
jgi:hypothetical protein